MGSRERYGAEESVSFPLISLRWVSLIACTSVIMDLVDRLLVFLKMGF